MKTAHVVSLLLCVAAVTAIQPLHSALNSFYPAKQLWTSTAFHLDSSASSIWCLATFFAISVSFIVCISIFQPPFVFDKNDYLPLHPVATTGTEDINATVHFIKYAMETPASAPSTQPLHDVENPPSTSSVPSLPTSIPKFATAISQVTMTFGTDKPEVYLKMMQEHDKHIICTCPCNHDSPHLANFPHISKISSTPTPCPPSCSSATDIESVTSVSWEKPMIAPPQSNAVTTTPSPPTDAFDFEAYTGRISDVSSPASPLSQTTSSTSSACPAHSDYLVPTKAQIIAQTSRAEMICVAHVLPRWSFYAALLMLFAFAKAMFDDLRNKPFVRRITNEK